MTKNRVIYTLVLILGFSSAQASKEKTEIKPASKQINSFVSCCATALLLKSALEQSQAMNLRLTQENAELKKKLEPVKVPPLQPNYAWMF